MNNKIIINILFLFLFASCTAKASYNNAVKVQIKLIDEESIQVSYLFPTIVEEKTKFLFPKTQEGTRRFIKTNDVSQFKILRNDSLVETIDKNSDTITINIAFDKIQYCVKLDSAENMDSYFASTFKTNDLLVLNFISFCGYIPEYRVTPYYVDISGIDNYQTEALQSKQLSYKYESYPEFINNPIYLSKAFETIDTVINNTLIHLNVKSIYKTVCLQDILKITSSSIHIALDELNKIGIDIPNYTINYVANDVLFNSVGVSQALERRNQTLIINYSDPYFYEDSDSLKFVATTQRILLHEMLHVFMPLAFKDSLLEPFRYNEKIMSGHLWLYEGFIEYQTVKLMFINNLITQTEFLDRLNNMIYSYIPYEKMGRFISLYKLSIDAFNETSLQLLFYNRAAILCFYADMLIYQRTNGEKDFWSILTEIYKENPVFNPDSLNNYLVQHTFPEFRSFIDTYIVGTKYLNPKSFEQFGLNYTLIKPDISTKHIPIQILSSKNRISDIAIRKYGSTPSNKEKLVSLVSINNLPISTYSISSVYSLIPRDYIQIICIENGIEKRDSLKTLPVILPKVPTFPSLTINEKDDFFERFIGN